MAHCLYLNSNDNCLLGFAALPTVLGLPEATNAFKYGQGTDENLYGWLESHPVQKAAFHRYMEHHLSSLPTWLEAVDVPTEMGAGIASQDIAFVDVGGDAGQQCLAFKAKFPTLPGRVILQDRPTVVEMAIVPEGVEKMGYNYLIEQPIKGMSRLHSLHHNIRSPMTWNLDIRNANIIIKQVRVFTIPPNLSQQR